MLVSTSSETSSIRDFTSDTRGTAHPFAKAGRCVGHSVIDHGRVWYMSDTDTPDLRVVLRAAAKGRRPGRQAIQVRGTRSMRIGVCQIWLNQLRHNVGEHPGSPCPVFCRGVRCGKWAPDLSIRDGESAARVCLGRGWRGAMAVNTRAGFPTGRRSSNLAGSPFLPDHHFVSAKVEGCPKPLAQGGQVLH